MRSVTLTGELTYNDILQLNNISRREQIKLVVPTTKGLPKELISKLDSKIIISITGGLNPQKIKFNNEHYQKRTYYTPQEVYQIISKYEEIERKINPLWSDLEKAMFVYKTICESFTYSESKYNNKEASRNLLGMLTNQSVCSGFALIFKEAMDRIDIPCIYQNRESHHSWNFIYIDGEYRAIELTWDTYEKQNNVCGFKYFCRENANEFYSNSHHDISQESEEIRYNAKEIPVSELTKALSVINKPKIFREKLNHRQSLRIKNNDIVIKNNVPYLSSIKNIYNTYFRQNGSSFLVFPTGKRDKGVNEYVYLIYNPKTDEIKCTLIYSEMNLVAKDSSLRSNIADNLMSESRMQNKINNFNGYIGYVTMGDRTRYYNESFEKNVIHVQRKK